MRGARTFVVAAFRHVTGHFVRTNPNTTATGLANSTALRLGLVRVKREMPNDANCRTRPSKMRPI